MSLPPAGGADVEPDRKPTVAVGRRSLVASAAVMVLAVAGIGASTASAQKPKAYWDRPWVEHRLVAKQVSGVSPIIDARCQGVGHPRFSAIGVRRYHQFSCKVLTNGGGRFPWVAVLVTPTGQSTFRAQVG